MERKGRSPLNCLNELWLVNTRCPATAIYSVNRKSTVAPLSITLVRMSRPCPPCVNHLHNVTNNAPLSNGIMPLIDLSTTFVRTARHFAFIRRALLPPLLSHAVGFFYHRENYGKLIKSISNSRKAKDRNKLWNGSRASWLISVQSATRPDLGNDSNFGKYRVKCV